MEIVVDIQFDDEVTLGVMIEERPNFSLVRLMEETGKENHFILKTPVWIPVENIITSYSKHMTLEKLGYSVNEDGIYSYYEDTLSDGNYTPSVTSEITDSDDSLN